MKKNVINISEIITYDIKLPWNISHKITVDLNSLSKQHTSPKRFKSHLNCILDEYKEHHKIYTDVFRTEEGVEISIILDNKQIMHEFPNKCLIFSAEAIAILNAIQLIIDEKHFKDIIFTDLLSSINNIKNIFHRGDIASLTHNNLGEAYKKYKQIKIIWIPGHSGIDGNEMTDKHAKIAIFNPNVSLLKQVPYSDTKS